MSRYWPDRKIWAGGLSAIVAWAIVQALQLYAGITVPADAQTMLSVGIGYAVSYVMPAAARDVISKIDGTLIEVIAANPSIPLDKSPAPAPQAKTTVVNGMTGRVMALAPLLIVLPLLGACTSVKTVESAAPAVTSAPITQAVQTVKDMPAAEKWRLACLGVDGLYIGYVAMAAPKLSDATNVKVQASYEAVKVVCANQPANYADGLVTLMQAVNAFKAAVPAKAGA